MSLDGRDLFTASPLRSALSDHPGTLNLDGKDGDRFGPPLAAGHPYHDA